MLFLTVFFNLKYPFVVIFSEISKLGSRNYVVQQNISIPKWPEKYKLLWSDSWVFVGRFWCSNATFDVLSPVT